VRFTASATLALACLLWLSPGQADVGDAQRPLPAPRPTPAAGGPYAALEVPVGQNNLMGREARLGRSARGRPIGVHQYGDPSLDGELLVVGCIHGTECAGKEIPPVWGCPSPDADIYKIGNLNPDGYAAGTRLNGRGVDLNRNFSAGWKPIGRRGSPQYSGPRPFSEPETRIAARFIRWLRPEVTIWFHQYHEARPLVRAWGGSVPAARRFARLAKVDFRRLHWLAGTAPNWQNHRFPASSSFVVELPPGPLPPRAAGRYGLAIVRLAKEVAAR
jgi:murein peptide amidase A